MISLNGRPIRCCFLRNSLLLENRLNNLLDVNRYFFLHTSEHKLGKTKSTNKLPSVCLHTEPTTRNLITMNILCLKALQQQYVVKQAFFSLF